MIKMPNRSYSKWMVAANSVMAWVVMIYSIYNHEAAYVAVAGFSFIAGLGGYYMKIGHNDLRETLTAISSSGKTTTTDMYGQTTQTIQPYTEPSGGIGVTNPTE